MQQHPQHCLQDNGSSRHFQHGTVRTNSKQLAHCPHPPLLLRSYSLLLSAGAAVTASAHFRNKPGY
jgi:hypothetical protein